MDRPPLTIALAQPDLRPLDLARNAAAHAAAIMQARSRLVVFPELSLTSYVLTAPVVSLNDPVWAPIIEACTETGSTALVGAPVEDPDGRTYIATLAVDGAGPQVVYRKIHVHESEERFTCGDRPAVLELDGWRLGLAICRDTNIDEHIAATVALGIDAYVGGSLDTPARAEARDQRMARLAKENEIWVAMSCFAGDGADFGPTAGGSAVWSPEGAIMVQADHRPARTTTATLA